MITSLNWPTLEQRRNYYKLVMMYKITRALAVIPSLFLTPLSTITRGHMQRLTVPSARVNSYLHLFLPTTTKLWNRLPEHLVLSYPASATVSLLGKSIKAITTLFTLSIMTAHNRTGGRHFAYQCNHFRNLREPSVTLENGLYRLMQTPAAS